MPVPVDHLVSVGMCGDFIEMYKGVFAVTGQTYIRKIDSKVLFLLSNIAQSAHKFSNDLRLLQHLKEIEEPFGKSQIGSSAMPYKRNPMKSERIGALSNFVISKCYEPFNNFCYSMV